MTKETRWAQDVYRYSRWLRLRDTQNNSIKAIELCDKILASIRSEWPNQEKVFDKIDREET